MCKRRASCSSTESHQMTIIPSPRHLNEKWADHYGDKEPIIVQEFIQHDGVIIKVYVAHGQIHASTRPSFINVTQDTGKINNKKLNREMQMKAHFSFLEIIDFDSQMLPKQFDDSTKVTSTSHTASRQLDSFRQLVLSSDTTNIQAQKEALLDYDRLQQIADMLYGQLVSLIH